MSIIGDRTSADDIDNRIVDGLRGIDPHRVEYAFECSTEGSVRWRVRSVDVEERLGATYCARLVLISEDVDALCADLLGQDCTIVIRRGDDATRTIHGVVSRVDHGKRGERHVVTNIEVVPALSLLRHVQDTRVFQGLNVLEIVEAFLGPLLNEYSRELRIESASNYLPREHCVQYAETSLDFFHRLCEEEGLTYFFDQSGDKEVVVLCDDNSSFVAAPLLPTATDVPFVAHRGNDIARTEPVHAFAASDRLGATSLSIGDFDWTSSTLPFSGNQRSRDAQDREREQYEHTRATTIAGYSKEHRAYTRRDIERRVQRGRERQALSTFEYLGAGGVIGFSAGTVFTLSGHPDVALDGDYLLLSVRHRGRDLHAGEGAPLDADASMLEYENEFVCIPAEVPYRPELSTPKPRIHGIQTACVVGPASEEVWTDEHGRIRVQFHWDREGRRDEESTCWIRVMQSWAGAGFGAMFIPRIGMEVVVSFLDGDPDRPLVTGCVYNAMNEPPTELPLDKTQSALRTRSSPGGNGFNELRFEDRAGDERVYLQAQKNLAEYVKHDHSTHVKHDQTNRVEHDQSNHVENDQTENIDGNQRVCVGGSREKVVSGDETNRIDGNRATEVLHADAITVTGTQEVTVGDRYSGTFRGGREVMVENGDRETVVSSNKRTAVEGAYDVEVNDRFRVRRDGTHVLVEEAIELSSPTRVRLMVGGNQVAIDSDGTVSLTAASELVLQCGSSKLSLKSDGTIEVNGSNKVELVAGRTSVSATPSGLSALGTQIDLNATGPMNIAGSMVKVN